MHKLTGGFLIFSLLLCIFCSSSLAQSDATVLVYMCGSDIQEDACLDIYEMAEAELGNNINLVILAGGAKNWEYEELRGGTRNLTVIRDFDFEFVKDWGKKSMGSEESLIEFLEYGLKQYPANKTIAILWDHGSGSSGGICFDETAYDDGLTLVEIDSALNTLNKKTGGFHIDIFGCDACMMATYELACILSHYNIDYYVGSQEMEPDLGWGYTAWLRALGKNPHISNRDLCQSIVDSYRKEGLADNPYDYLTMSAIDLSKIAPLEKSMEGLASSLVKNLNDTNFSQLRRGRSRLYTFGSFCDSSRDMVDLGAVLDTYAQFAPEQAAEAKRCLTQAVAVNWYTNNLDSCSGLSVFIPQDRVTEYSIHRSRLNLTAYIPNWVQFINGYTDILQNGHFTFNAITPQQVTGEVVTSGFFSSLATQSGGYSWNANSDTYEAQSFQTDTGNITVSDSEFGFTATIPKSELDYLDYVEGMLLLDISDDEAEFYVELGLVRDNRIDWQTGEVFSKFDGSWPLLGDQIVPLYDQAVNEHARRSLIPVRLNGKDTYLVVVFPTESSEGQVIGANAGYDDNGLPIRATTKLKNGDKIVPIYTTYYGDYESDLEDEEIEGDPIIWSDGMTVTYEDLRDPDDPMDVLFCFVFNDIFGDFTMSDYISFKL